MMAGLDVFRLWQTEAKGKITRLWWKQEDTVTWLFFFKEVYLKKNGKALDWWVWQVLLNMTGIKILQTSFVSKLFLQSIILYMIPKFIWSVETNFIRLPLGLFY